MEVSTATCDAVLLQISVALVVWHSTMDYGLYLYLLFYFKRPK
jgi:hypothetical protein